MTKKKEKISIHEGKHIWKSPLEYHNKHTFLHGYPYYRITEVDDLYYFWELDYSDPDHPEYRVKKTGNDFSPLFDEGMELNEVLGKKYDKGRLHYLSGKELVEKLKST